MITLREPVIDLGAPGQEDAPAVGFRGIKSAPRWRRAGVAGPGRSHGSFVRAVPTHDLFRPPPHVSLANRSPQALAAGSRGSGVTINGRQFRGRIACSHRRRAGPRGLTARAEIQRRPAVRSRSAPVPEERWGRRTGRVSFAHEVRGSAPRTLLATGLIKRADRAPVGVPGGACSATRPTTLVALSVFETLENADKTRPLRPPELT